MHHDEFEAPALFWVWLPLIGGLATAAGLILGLEWLGNRLPTKTASPPPPAFVAAPDAAQPWAIAERQCSVQELGLGARFRRLSPGPR